MTAADRFTQPVGAARAGGAGACTPHASALNPRPTQPLILARRWRLEHAVELADVERRARRRELWRWLSPFRQFASNGDNHG